MMLSIDAIADATNARIVASLAVEDDHLLASMRSLGQLQPIVVTRGDNGDNGYSLIAGRRRLAAARILGWTEIAAHEVGRDPISGDAMSAAENMVRAPMHPVDTWRAMHRLTENGYTLAGAAMALGIDERTARRLDRLGAMAPEVVTAIADEHELPEDRELRLIALAPHATQQRAVASAQKARGKRESLDWWRVAQACDCRRIPSVRAIFMVGGGDVVFEEDLFAEPGSDQQFTTSDVKGFIAAQWAALKNQAEASKGRIAVALIDKKNDRAVLPIGWRESYDAMPKRWKKDDPRRAFGFVVEDGYNLGSVHYIVGHPAAKPAKAAVTSQVNGAEPVTRAPREPMTKAAQTLIAVMKAEAVREALPRVLGNENPADMLRALLMMLALDNVRLPDRRSYGAGPYHFLANSLIGADGQPHDLDESALCQLAADAIDRAVQFSAPNLAAGGKAAEWLAVMLGAQLPRCDTEEVLKGCSKDLLIETARAHGIDEKGTSAQLRTRMIGKLPDWRAATFGTAGPDPAENDNDDAEAQLDEQEGEQEDAA